jgi:enoyl-CoA hydratase/carnithine racemase
MNLEKVITTEIQDHILLIGLNRDEKYNAFNIEMLKELAKAYTQLENDPKLWCGLIYSTGKHFTTGLDLAEVGPAVLNGAPLFPPDSIDPLGLSEPYRTKPIVCAVNGLCFTIGVELLLAADVRVAAKSARFAQMEVRRGIMPFGGATIRMVQVAGWGNAMRHLLTGDEFNAQEALRIGLVQDTVETGQEFTHAFEIAKRITAQAPLAISEILCSAQIARDKGPQAASQLYLKQIKKLMKTEDAAEGMQSFIERRVAKFSGK